MVLTTKVPPLPFSILTVRKHPSLRITRSRHLKSVILFVIAMQQKRRMVFSQVSSFGPRGYSKQPFRNGVFLRLQINGLTFLTGTVNVLGWNTSNPSSRLQRPVFRIVVWIRPMTFALVVYMNTVDVSVVQPFFVCDWALRKPLGAATHIHGATCCVCFFC
jgi:hypothetical protein